MTGTSWRAVSVPTQKSNGDLPRASGLTVSPGRSAPEGSQARVLNGAPTPARRLNVGLIGAAGASTPDDDAYTIGAPGNSGIDVAVHCWRKRWAATGTTHWFANQGDHVFTTDLAWAASIHPNRALRLAVSVDGTNFFGPESTAPVPFQPGTSGWVRLVYQNVFNLGFFFYFTSTNGQDWVPLGDNLNNGAYIQPRNSAQPITVPGTFADDAEYVTFEARIAVNTVPVANPRFDTLTPRTSSFLDDYRRPWTISAPGLIGVV
jgi:hypothetical protein